MKDTSTEFRVNPNLIDRDLAIRSHRGTSFDSEERGEQEISRFSQGVETTHADILKSAETDEERSIINEEMKTFQIGYAKMWNAQIAAHSRIVSPMITGPANFPVSQNEKAYNSYENRVVELNAWYERAVTAIYDKLNNHRVALAGGEIEVMKAELASAETLQVTMKGCNKIIRSKKLSADEKVARMVADFDLSEDAVHKILTPDCTGGIGFSHSRLTNNNARLKRMRGRVATMQVRATTPTTKIEFSGGEIIDNNSMDRVQIYFNEKPDEAMRTKLRSSGWHWAPSNGMWQRKRTNAAMRSAKQIIGGS